MMRVIRMVSSGAGIDQKGIQKNLLGFWDSFLSICRSKFIDPQTLKICAFPCSLVKIKTFIQNTLFNLLFIFFGNFTLYLAKLFKAQSQIFLKYKSFSLIYYYFFPMDSDLFHRKSNFPYSFHSLQCLVVFFFFFFWSFSFAFCENFSVGSSHHRC